MRTAAAGCRNWSDEPVSRCHLRPWWGFPRARTCACVPVRSFTRSTAPEVGRPGSQPSPRHGSAISFTRRAQCGGVAGPCAPPGRGRPRSSRGAPPAWWAEVKGTPSTWYSVARARRRSYHLSVCGWPREGCSRCGDVQVVARVVRLGVVGPYGRAPPAIVGPCGSTSPVWL